MGPELKCSLASFCLLVAACGEAKYDFFDETATASGTVVPTTQGSTPSSGGAETSMTGSTSGSTGAGGSNSGDSNSGDSGGSNSGGSGDSDTGGSNAESTSADAEAAASDTTSSGGAATSTTASTTGAANDPECPASAPEATTFCNGSIGLSCTYDDVTCVCSGLTWNCMGGETTSGNTGNNMGPDFGANGFGTGGTFND